MASDDNDSSSNFFTDNLDRNDTERDLYAILHINKDVQNEKLFSYYLIKYLLGRFNSNSTSLSSFNTSLSPR
jgi:hypothetical protein